MNSIAEEIFAARPAFQKKEKVEAWGKELWIWGLMGDERDRYEGDRVVYDAKGKATIDYANSRAKLVVLSLRDGAGADAKRVFHDLHVGQVGQLDALTLDRLYGIACKLSGLRTGDEEEAEKNSAPTPPAASSSS